MLYNKHITYTHRNWWYKYVVELIIFNQYRYIIHKYKIQNHYILYPFTVDN